MYHEDIQFRRVPGRWSPARAAKSIITDINILKPRPLGDVVGGCVAQNNADVNMVSVIILV